MMMINQDNEISSSNSTHQSRQDGGQEQDQSHNHHLLVSRSSESHDRNEEPIQNLGRKRIAILLSSLFDVTVFVGLMTFLTLYYYDDPNGRLLWKLGLTCNFWALLFEFRIRVLKCCGYPLKEMRRAGCCFEFTRIRMKLADYFCFFYIFFCELIDASVLVMKQYKSDHERIMFISVVSINAFYLVAWIVFTKSSSFNRFPKEKARSNPTSPPQVSLHQEQTSFNQEGGQRRNQDIFLSNQANHIEKRRLNKQEAAKLIKSMPVILVTTNQVYSEAKIYSISKDKKMKQENYKSSNNESEGRESSAGSLTFSLLQKHNNSQNQDFIRNLIIEDLGKEYCAICLESLLSSKYQDAPMQRKIKDVMERCRQEQDQESGSRPRHHHQDMHHEAQLAVVKDEVQDLQDLDLTTQQQLPYTQSDNLESHQNKSQKQVKSHSGKQGANRLVSKLQSLRDLFKNKILSKSSKDQFVRIRAFPECNHLYHEPCLQSWIQESDSCPMCRRRTSSICLEDEKEQQSTRLEEEDDELDDDIENLLFYSDKKTKRKQRQASSQSQDHLTSDGGISYVQDDSSMTRRGVELSIN